MLNTLLKPWETMIAEGRTHHLSHVLMQSQVGLKRRPFDPTDPADRMQYAYFLKHGKWKDSRSFLVEVPFHTVPSTINSKLLNYFLAPEFSSIDANPA